MQLTKKTGSSTEVLKEMGWGLSNERHYRLGSWVAILILRFPSVPAHSVKQQGFSTNVNQKLGITIFTWGRQLLSFLVLQTWKNEVWRSRDLLTVAKPNAVVLAGAPTLNHGAFLSHYSSASRRDGAWTSYCLDGTLIICGTACRLMHTQWIAVQKPSAE